MTDAIAPARRTGPAEPGRVRTKPLNLALQGGGSHGAFGWGVLDALLEDGRIDIDGLSATSAGAMNAVAYAYGHMHGGKPAAREMLTRFWRRVSEKGALYSPVRRTPFDGLLAGFGRRDTFSFKLFQRLTHMFSPYEFNPLNVNPLREVLAELIDFDILRACDCVELSICATNVRTGKPRIFRNGEITADAVLASAALPTLFQAVEIDGAHYWDGGFIGNPALYPLIYNTQTRDILIVHINPIVRDEVPRTAEDIHNRINEITFNASLVGELRAIAFVSKLLESGAMAEPLRDRYSMMLIHSIRSDDAMSRFSVASKFETDWSFLTHLRDLGRAAAAAWLAEHFTAIGVRSTVDIREHYL